MAAFQRYYRLSAISSLYREAALRKLLGGFNACGIPVILLKGCYLGRFVYKDPALRPMDDVDVLVPGAGVEDHPGVLPRILGLPLNLFVAMIFSGIAVAGYILCVLD
jgi:hypothetical protein